MWIVQDALHFLDNAKAVGESSGEDSRTPEKNNGIILL